MSFLRPERCRGGKRLSPAVIVLAGLLFVVLIDGGRLRSFETKLRPGRGLPDEVAVSGFKREPCMIEIEQGKAGGAAVLDSASSIPLRVVGG